MRNPFSGMPMLSSTDQLVGRERQLEDLQGFMAARTDSVLFGPEGSGKSTLLRCFFNVDYCKQMAKEQRTLIFFGEFPTGMTDEDTYGYFADAVRSSVEILEYCGRYDEMDIILRSLDRGQYDSKKSRFDQYLNKIIRAGYRMVFVLDNFENFTSSRNIKTEHHDLLCGMLNDFKLQLIVATNYDFNKTSLPAGTKNSLLLSRLSPNSIGMAALDAEQCGELLERALKGCGNSFRFTPGQVFRLWEISGGIPLLLNIAARHALDSLAPADGEEPEGWDNTVLERSLEEARAILKRWCKILSGEQLALLSALLKRDGYFTDDENTVAKVLVSPRGLLKNAFELDRQGRAKTVDGYIYNSLIFERFCQRPEWLEEAVQDNPLKQEDAVLTPVFDPAALLGSNALPPIQPVYHIEKYYATGAEDNSQTVKAEHITVQQGITPSQLLGILAESGGSKEMFAQRLGACLRQCLPRDALPKSSTGADEQDNAQQRDAEFDRVSHQLIQDVEVDEDQELVDVSPVALQTLDERFEQVRKRRANITDRLLNRLSERCRLYVKLSVVVEDALTFSEAFVMEDFSPQLVLYCKALEQSLRDGFYDLFHKDQTLSVYNTYSGKEDGFSPEVFRNKTARETNIGSYACLIAAKKDYLGQLCTANRISLAEGAQPASWSGWWGQLQTDIHAARNIRNNMTAHPGDEAPGSTELDHMCELLFGDQGSGGILEGTVVGRRLYQTVFVPAIPYAAIERLVGHSCEMECTTLKTNGGIKGVTCDGGYLVNVSPKRVKKYRESRSGEEFNPVGKRFNVQILECASQDSADFFAAEILGLSS